MIVSWLVGGLTHSMMPELLFEWIYMQFWSTCMCTEKQVCGCVLCLTIICKLKCLWQHELYLNPLAGFDFFKILSTTTFAEFHRGLAIKAKNLSYSIRLCPYTHSLWDWVLFQCSGCVDAKWHELLEGHGCNTHYWRCYCSTAEGTKESLLNHLRKREQDRETEHLLAPEFFKLT